MSGSSFKNALCLARIPEESNPAIGRMNWMSVLDVSCRRTRQHAGEHRSRWKVWNEGDKESKTRERKQRS